MRRPRSGSLLLLALLAPLGGCATTPRTVAAPLERCSLEAEEGCVAYGATVLGPEAAPADALVVGLADRSAALPAEEAVDYWRRIEELVSVSEREVEAVNRRAARAYASLAELAVEDVKAEADTMEATFAAGQEALDRVRQLGEHAVRWGEPGDQALGARAIANAYARHADNLAAFEVPAELKVDARLRFEQKRDALVSELREQAAALAAGVDEHCRRHRLKLASCVDAQAPAPPPPPPRKPRVVVWSVNLEGVEALTAQPKDARALLDLQRAAQHQSQHAPASWYVFFHAFDGNHLEFVDAARVEEPPQERWRARKLYRVDRTPEIVAAFGLQDVIAQHEDGVCGIRVGMGAQQVLDRFGPADDVQHPAAAGCELHSWGELTVTFCFETVRAVQRPRPEGCP